jgi:hypothetical protein
MTLSPGLRMEINARWTTLWGTSLRNLIGPAADSPFTASARQWSLNAGVGWQFWLATCSVPQTFNLREHVLRICRQLQVGQFIGVRAFDAELGLDCMEHLQRLRQFRFVQESDVQIRISPASRADRMSADRGMNWRRQPGRIVFV